MGRPLSWGNWSADRKVNYLADFIFGEVPVSITIPMEPVPEPEPEPTPPVDTEPDMPPIVPSKRVKKSKE
jgi:hypothetical protein